MEIERLKEGSPDVQFVEIITEYCETNDIDIEAVPKLITTSLHQKISRESRQMRLIEDNTEVDPLDGVL